MVRQIPDIDKDSPSFLSKVYKENGYCLPPFKSRIDLVTFLQLSFSHWFFEQLSLLLEKVTRFMRILIGGRQYTTFKNTFFFFMKIKIQIVGVCKALLYIYCNKTVLSTAVITKISIKILEFLENKNVICQIFPTFQKRIFYFFLQNTCSLCFNRYKKLMILRQRT